MKRVIQSTRELLICFGLIVIASSCSNRNQRTTSLYGPEANEKVVNALGVSSATNAILYIKNPRGGEVLTGSAMVGKRYLPDCNWLFAAADTSDAIAVLGSAKSHFDADVLPLMKDQLDFTAAEDYLWARMEGTKSGVLIYRVKNSTLYFDLIILEEQRRLSTKWHSPCQEA